MCVFCDEIESGKFILDGKDNDSRILFESENFVVFPGLGQIKQGYLLIVSKEHYFSVGHMPEELYPELDELSKKVRKLLKKFYVEPIFFEHGAVSDRKGVCCVNHLHLHAMPVDLDILPELSKEYQAKKISSYSSLKEQYNKNKPYFFYENNKGQKYLFNIPKIVPSQKIRQVIAKKVGVAEHWDWRIHYGLDDLRATISKLRKHFK